MVTFRFTIKGKQFFVSSESYDPKTVVEEINKEIISIMAKEKVDEDRYLIQRIAKALTDQYPIKGEAEALELGDLSGGSTK